MSSARKPKVVKVLPEPAPVSAEAKPKRTRAPKHKPTKDEMLKLLSDSSVELKQIMQDLKEDETKIAGLTLKQLPLLITETLKNLNEDCEDIDAEYQTVLAAPAN